MLVLLLGIFNHIIFIHDHSTSCSFYLVFHFLFIEFNYHAQSVGSHSITSQNTLTRIFLLLFIWVLALFLFLVFVFHVCSHSLLTSYQFMLSSSLIISISHHLHIPLLYIGILSSCNVFHLQKYHYPSDSFSFIITFSSFSLHFQSVCFVVLHD